MAQQPKQSGVAIPSSLDIKDIITIISVAISLTAAWGVFSTRITVLEREALSMKETIQAQATTIDKLQQQVQRLNAHQQDDELFIDQLYSNQRKLPPRRSN